MEITKAIIPMAGYGTRFLPETKIVSKELLPLADKPMFSYLVKEAKEAGLSKIVFVLPEAKRTALDYFKASPKLEKCLKERNQKERLAKLKQIEQEAEGLSFSYVVQKIPKGDGDAVLKAKSQVGNSPFAVLFVDDIFAGRKPAIGQLMKVFSTAQKPVLGLKKVSEDKLSAYGVVQAEKIASRLYKIKGIVEKPALGQAPSDLAICGRYLLTGEVFQALAKTPPSKKGEIILADAFKKMLNEGKIIYGYELEGEWLECGKTIDWLRSNLFICLEHPEYGPLLKKWLKERK